MGTEKPRVSQAKLFKDVPLVERPHILSERENDERLDRIATSIIQIIRGIQIRERGKRGRPHQLPNLDGSDAETVVKKALGLVPTGT